MDEQQDKAFREAVERKKAEAKAASEETNRTGGVPPEGEELPLEQQSLIDDSTPQDVASARDKNERKGKVTADKWNQ